MNINFPESFPAGDNLIVRKVAETKGLPHYAIYRVPGEQKILEFRIQPEDIAHREFTLDQGHGYEAILAQSPALVSYLIDKIYSSH
jgi:hypothetical protein